MAAPYAATILNSSGYNDPAATAIYGNVQVGYSNAFGGSNHALLWQGNTASAVDLTPSGYSAEARATTGVQQVGSGYLIQPTFYVHALMWSGTADSMVDLNPPGYQYSDGFGIWGDTQIGSGTTSSNAALHHALVWHGTPTSAVDINPSGYTSSVAQGIFGDEVIGWGSGPATLGGFRALLWNISTGSVIDLSPVGIGPVQSFGMGVSGNSQVGYWQPTSTQERAALWHGSPESLVDLTPAGYTSCRAVAVAGGQQVGSCDAIGSRFSRARLWYGSAESVVDLHAAVTAIIPGAIGSSAVGVDANGNVVGVAVDNNQHSYAILWTPVPEPTTCVLLVHGFIVSLVCAGRRVSRRHEMSHDFLRLRRPGSRSRAADCPAPNVLPRAASPHRRSAVVSVKMWLRVRSRRSVLPVSYLAGLRRTGIRPGNALK